jgi:hypothetical protein
MRKQYHPLRSEGRLLVWDVDRLVQLAEKLPTKSIPLEEIWELDEIRWFDSERELPTCRAILEHIRLVVDSDAAFPIILGSDGRVMDGMHRILKVALEGGSEIKAKQFDVDPEPDYLDVDLDDLPY